MSMSKDTLQENARVWERLGPISSGGTVFGLALSPVKGVGRYWAATGCGIFATDDGGETWVQSITGLATPLLSALAVAANGGVVRRDHGGDVLSPRSTRAHWQTG
jgi:hypothetical protein